MAFIEIGQNLCSEIAGVQEPDGRGVMAMDSPTRKFDRRIYF